MEHKASGHRTPIHVICGKYIMKMWVRKAKENHANTGRFNALMNSNEEEGAPGFARLGEDWM